MFPSWTQRSQAVARQAIQKQKPPSTLRVVFHSIHFVAMHEESNLPPDAPTDGDRPDASINVNQSLEYWNSVSSDVNGMLGRDLPISSQSSDATGYKPRSNRSHLSIE
jgi:hypothetical protein